jgi:hypothetical protein
MQTHGYHTARGIGKFIAGIGWIAVILGGLAVVLILGGRAGGEFGIVGLPLAFGLSVGGLLLVGQGQLIQAAADTARSSQRAVEVLEQVLSALNASSRETPASPGLRGLTADQSISHRRS